MSSALSLYVRLGDPLFDEVFRGTFKEFVVEKHGHIIKIPISRFLEILTAEHGKVWQEEIAKGNNGSQIENYS